MKIAEKLFQKPLLSVLLLFYACNNCADETSVSSQPEYYHISIPTLPLSEALLKLSFLSNSKILFRSDSVKNIKSKPLQGEYTVNEALTTLLQDSPLRYKSLRKNHFVILPVGTVTQFQEGNPSATPKIDSTKPDDIPEITVIGENLSITCCRDSPSTATKTNAATMDIPRSVEGIDRRLFEERSNLTLTETFRDFSTVGVTDYAGNISVRGFKLDGDSLTKDGLAAFTRGITSPLLQNIDGIEVAKGVNSTLYGFGQPGAVINLITKKPQAKAFHKISALYGSDVRFFGIDSNTPSLTSRAVSARFNVAYQEEEHHSDLSGTSTQFQVSPALRFIINPDTELDVTLEYNHQIMHGYRGVRPVDRYGQLAKTLLNDPQSETTILELLYPGLDNAVGELDFYPNHGDESRDMGQSDILEFRSHLKKYYGDSSQVNWSFSAGNHKLKRSYRSDMFVLSNLFLDPSNPSLSLSLMRFLYDNYPYSIQNNVNTFDSFMNIIKEKEPFLSSNAHVTDIYFDGGNTIPYWDDQSVRFYQVPYDSDSQSKKINTELSYSYSAYWGSTQHAMMLGINYLYDDSDSRLKHRYNRFLYEQGDRLLASQDWFIGYALKRYSLFTWYKPFEHAHSNAIELPTDIASLAGISAQQSFPLDGTFTVDKSKVTTRNLGLFAQDHITLNPNWHLYMALGYYRYDKKISDIEQSLFALYFGEQELIPFSTKPSDHVISSQTGLVFKPNEDLALFTNYGKQFTILSGVDKNQQPLGHEESENYELGLNWWLNTDLNVMISLFETTVLTWLVSDSENSFFNATDGKLRSRGGEVNINGFASPHVQLTANYSQQQLKSLRDIGRSSVFYDGATAGVADSLGNLWLTYCFQSYGQEGFSIGLGANYVDKREIRLQQLIIPYDSYTTYDASLGYKLQDMRLALNIDNVTDVDWVSGKNPYPDINSASYVTPGYERRYRFSIVYYYQ